MSVRRGAALAGPRGGESVRIRAAWAAVLLLALACMLGLARAQVPIPELHARVTDATATLSAAQVAALDDKLAALETRKGAQIAVLLIPTLAAPGEAAPSATIEDYAVRVFERWKLGRKGVDDGVLLVVVTQDRKVRIEVGYGLEGAIPDVAAARIIREYVAPKFRDGDFYGGIDDAVTALAGLIDGEALPAPLDVRDVATPEVQWWAAMLATVFASLLLGFLLAATLQCLFNIFPVGVLPVVARRVAGAMAGPLILVALIAWAVTRDRGGADSVGTLLTSGALPLGLAHLGVASAITGGLGWSIAANGASRQWIGGMSWTELLADVVLGIFSLVVSAIFDGILSSGGSRGGGGFSGGGGSSGGGGASGSW